MSESDSTLLSLNNKNKKNGQDFSPLLIEMIKSIEYKYYAFMFIIFLFITSDIFIDRVLNNFNGALEFHNPTSYGTIIQAITLIISMITVHILIKKQIV